MLNVTLDVQMLTVIILSMDQFFLLFLHCRTDEQIETITPQLFLGSAYYNNFKPQYLEGEKDSVQAPHHWKFKKKKLNLVLHDILVERKSVLHYRTLGLAP